MQNILLYNFYGFYTLLKRELSRFMKVYIQTLVAPLLSNILFLGIFGGMLKTREAGIDGVGYLSYLVPGLCAMGAIFSAFQNPAFSLITQKYTNTIYDLNSYPLTNFEKVLAFILGGTIRGFLIGTVTYLATIFFIGYNIKYPFLFFGMLMAISFIFSGIGIAAGLMIKNFDILNFILSIILTPMVYFGGVFFELSKLPRLFSLIAFINPLYPMINLTRFGFLGYHEDGILMQLIIILIIIILSFLSAYYVFKKGFGIKE